jgi:hypothetical protein
MAASILKVHGVPQLKTQLTLHANRARRQTRRRVIVGYSAPYAAYVHENVEMKWRGRPRRSGIGVYWGPRGQAKFLAEPARRLRRAIGRRILQVTRSTRSVARGLYSGGVLLRDASVRLVPVEHGVLRDSVYIQVVDLGPNRSSRTSRR